MDDKDEHPEEGIESIERSEKFIESKLKGLEKLKETLAFLKREDDVDVSVQNRKDCGILDVYVSSETPYDEFKFLCDISTDLTSYTANRSLDYDPHSETYKISVNFAVER